MTTLEQVVGLLLEAAHKPGVMSLAGIAAEKRCAKDVAAYFQLLGHRLEGSALMATTEHHDNKVIIQKVVRSLSPRLHMILQTNIMEAMLAADRQEVVHEAETPVRKKDYNGL